MHKPVGLAAMVMLASSSFASWYWPFGDDAAASDSTNAVETAAAEEEHRRPARLSEMMAPASDLIEEASDLAADGKIDESVAKYRAAAAALDRIEAENPERAKKPEFATLRTKRAYVNATIDALLLEQVRENAKPIAVSDTEALERALAAERAAKTAKPKAEKPKVEKPHNPREQVMGDFSRGDYAAAAIVIEEMLIQKPNDAKALNLRAAMEAAQGKFREAERTLDQAIQSNPRNHYAYYNMAELILRAYPANRSSARRYYESGRALGGPADRNLEEALK